MTEKTLQKTDEKKDTELKKSSEETREKERFLSPAVDIYETEDKLIVLADMPGVDKKDIDVKVDNNILTIKGKSKEFFRGDLIYKEFDLFNYYRQFELNEEVDQNKIKGELKHGVLTITLPKVEKPKPKQITIDVV